MLTPSIWSAFTAVGFQIHGFIFGGHLRPYSTAGLAFGIACDSLIAGAIIYYLNMKRTIFSRTNHAINLLITYALNTCLLTTVFSFFTLITFLVYSETMVYTVFWFVLTRLYTCSMLSTLNSRENVRQALENHDLISFSSLRVGGMRPEVHVEVCAETDSKCVAPSIVQTQTDV
ncbi:hypothetical protein DAEQUDRAFT_275228 [Daedalea quercina L-15889]|uniref:DUF6534 domain-containing protein n=1 Tax=Daedalea quercina L-15889 TaxID=1314783 RepID=A0A165Q6U0_9APHY|nr:hypothetical protein DAEQUDRAFT_275228 [Daedalea quercina L-15889]